MRLRFRVVSTLVVAGWARVASADVLVVDTLADQVLVDGDCSIREAFDALVAGGAAPDCATLPGDDTVLLDAVGTYVLAAPLVVPGGASITVRGDSDHPRGSYWLDRGNQGRILQLDPGSAATVEHLVMWRGYVTGAEAGGAIRALDADLELRDVTLLTNVAADGAGLYWEADAFDLRGRGGHAAGGPARRLAVESVEFVDGLATVGGFGTSRGAGAMVFAGGDSDVRLADVRFSLNLATNAGGNDGSGGGLWLALGGQAHAQVVSADFSSNTSHGDGGAAYLLVVDAAQLEILDSLFTANAGDPPILGSLNNDGSLRVGRSRIVANHSDPFWSQARFSLDGSSQLTLDSLVVGHGDGLGLYVGLHDQSQFLGGHLTITDHPGFGLQLVDASSSSSLPRLESSILWNNGAGGIDDIDFPILPWPTLARMLIGELDHTDPAFVDPANGNYELSAGSLVAINGGDAAFATVGPWDVRHGRRVVGPAPDLGAFERGSLFAWDAEEGDTVAWSGQVPMAP